MRTTGIRLAAGAVAVGAAAVLTGCGMGTTAAQAPAGRQTTSDAPAPTTSSPDPTTSAPTATTTSPTATATTPKPHVGLQVGDTGAKVLALQQRLASLGYWNGTADGHFGDLTQQAVYALQKAAGLPRDGVVGPTTQAAVDRGVRPSIHSSGSGHRVEIDKSSQLLLVIDGGSISMILNTSTGSGRHYSENGASGVAITPTGTFHVYREVDHADTGPLGTLWKPKYFTGGYAVHGLSSVPPYPASHGCARVSNAAMDMIWARNLLPIGTAVTVLA